MAVLLHAKSYILATIQTNQKAWYIHVSCNRCYYWPSVFLRRLDITLPGPYNAQRFPHTPSMLGWQDSKAEIAIVLRIKRRQLDCRQLLPSATPTHGINSIWKFIRVPNHLSINMDGGFVEAWIMNFSRGGVFQVTKVKREILGTAMTSRAL